MKSVQVMGRGGGKMLEWTLGVIGAGARRGKRPRGAVDNRADKLWLRTCECIMGGSSIQYYRFGNVWLGGRHALVLLL